MKLRFLVSIALLCAAMPAPAAKPKLPATPIHTSQPAEIIFSQQEIAVSVPDTANAVSMQFGLIGALVGTAVSNAQVKKAEERVRGLRDTLLDYPFNARMEEVLRRKLDTHTILAGQGLRVLDATWDGDSASMADPVEDAVVLVPGYSVSSSFEQLSVTLALRHVQRTARADRKPKQKILFSRQYAFHFPLQALEGHGADETAARWEAMGRAGLEALIDQGIEQVTDMLVYDLSTEGRSEAELPIRGLSGTVGGQEFDGRVVREGERWLWLRSGPGALRTLAGHHPVDEQRVAALQAAAPAVAATADGMDAAGNDGQGSDSAPASTVATVDAADAADAQGGVPVPAPAPAPASGSAPDAPATASGQATVPEE